MEARASEGAIHAIHMVESYTGSSVLAYLHDGPYRLIGCEARCQSRQLCASIVAVQAILQARNFTPD